MNVVIKLRGATSDITSDKLNYCIDNKWGGNGNRKKKKEPAIIPTNKRQSRPLKKLNQ